MPTESDWLEASRIQFLLAQERKKDAGGKSPRRTAKVKQELALDCLIAVSACRENIIVVTNDSDFWAIKRYLKKIKTVKVLRLEKKRFVNVNFKPLFCCI